MLLGAWPLGGGKTPCSGQTTKYNKIRFFVLLGGYGLFLVFGAAIFSAIEAPKMDELSKKIINLRTKFLNEFSCISGE